MPLMKFEMTRRHSLKFEAIGTQWEIVLDRPLLTETHEKILKYIEAFDLAYSRFREGSLVRKIADGSLEQTFPDSAEEIFNFYDVLYELTGGSVTPMVGDTLEGAGYDSHYSLKPKQIVTPKEYKKNISRTGAVVTATEPCLLDIGAVGKGYLVDSIVTTLQAAGYENILVDGSGDLRVVGMWTEKIGLENPCNVSEVIGTITLQNKALCASATNRRKWGEWHHVIDPKTAKPTEDIIATWVAADSAMLADGLATALFFTHPDILKTKYNYEYLRVHKSGKIEYSDYFAKGIF